MYNLDEMIKSLEWAINTVGEVAGKEEIEQLKQRLDKLKKAQQESKSAENSDELARG